MKLEKLAKTLRRDLAANPLKAGVLGILLLGGLYFWGPLLWKWVGKKGPAGAPGVAASGPSVADAAGGPSGGVQAASGVVSTAETEFKCQEVRRQRESDPLTRSAVFRPEWGHAFQVTTVAAAAAAEDETSPANGGGTTRTEVSPQQLGLELQGVAIGSKTKKAIINGVVYRELDWITARQPAVTSDERGEQLQEFKFKVINVYRNLVELERGGKTWTLELASDEQLSKQDRQPEQPRIEPTGQQGIQPGAKPATREEEE